MVGLWVLVISTRIELGSFLVGYPVRSAPLDAEVLSDYRAQSRFSFPLPAACCNSFWFARTIVSTGLLPSLWK